MLPPLRINTFGKVIMRRNIAFTALFALLLALAVPRLPAAEPAPTRYVVTQGALAGSQVTALPDGRAQLSELPGGVTGLVRSPDGGRTWFYVAADGTHNPLRSADEAPAYARQISDVVTALAQLERGRAQASLRLVARSAASQLARAADAWSASAVSGGEEAGAAQLAVLSQTLERTADQATDVPAVTALREALPRLRALAATALLQPRDTIDISPAAPSLGQVPVGNTSSIAITVTSTSAAKVAVGVNLAGLTAPFSSTAGPQLQVKAGHPGIIPVSFTPTAAGPFTGAIVLTNAAFPGGSVTINVTGTGIAANITTAPNPVDFGRVVINTEAPPKNLTITNASTVQAEFKVEFLLSAPFGFGGKKVVIGTLQPGANSRATLTFAPKKIGVYSGMVKITSATSPNTSQLVEVKGVGIGILTASTQTLDFGDVKIGATSAPKTVTVTNNTNTAQPLAIKAPNNGFAIGTVPNSVPANGSVDIPVTFTPAKTGSAESKFSVTTGGKEAFTVETKGNGVENTSVSFSGSTMAFGTVMHGMGATQSVTLTNRGDTSFAVTLDRTHLPTGFFTVETPMSFTVAPGDHTDITIFFEANAKCNHKGKLLVTVDGETFAIDVTAAAD